MGTVEKNKAGKGGKVAGEKLQIWKGGQGNCNMHERDQGGLLSHSGQPTSDPREQLVHCYFLQRTPEHRRTYFMSQCWPMRPGACCVFRLVNG